MSEVAPQSTAIRHDNGFDILRLLGAVFVLFGHAYPLAGQPASPGFLGNHIQTIGVKIFFVISGYLITKSWLSEPKVSRFVQKRFLRIFPGLAANVVFVSCVLAASVTALGAAEYFGSHGLLRYFRNILFYPVYDLPGVFASNIYPVAVNGSLWSLPVEVLMYVTVPILFLNGRRNSLLFAAIVTALFCAVGLEYVRIQPSGEPTVIYGTNLISAADVACYFQIGALYTFVDQRFLKRPILALATLFICARAVNHYVLGEIVLMLLLPYCVISLGSIRSSLIARGLKGVDLSYGLYLYGFPVQQLLMHKMTDLAPVTQFLYALPITLALAACSWFLIERPALKLKSIRLGSKEEK